jgi:3-oxoacyl-[acyl-carrier-protein] synthase II
MTTQARLRRVVVTGCGAITPLGCTVPDFWTALLAGRSGIRSITRFDASLLRTRIAAEVTGFNPGDHLSRRVYHRIDPFAQYALVAAKQAAEEAKLEVDEDLAPRLAVLIGSAYGASISQQAVTLALQDPERIRRINPFSSAATAIDSAAGEIVLQFGATGPSGAVTTACASGTTSVGEAYRAIRHGYYDVAIAGGADDSITMTDIAAASAAGALSRRNDEPERASRPFDRGRDGFVVGAGAGIVIVEEAGRAVDRGAPILAELVGYGATSDAHHPTAPHPDGLGARRAMRQALAEADAAPDEVDYINAHGTSTAINDRIESAAIRAELGAHATTIPISSIKSMVGHMIGAAGTVELIATIMAMRTGQVPPTINCDDPEDPELNYVPHRPQERRIQLALSNSFGFAGHNAVLAVRPWQP